MVAWEREQYGTCCLVTHTKTVLYTKARHKHRCRLGSFVNQFLGGAALFEL